MNSRLGKKKKKKDGCWMNSRLGKKKDGCWMNSRLGRKKKRWVLDE